MQRAPSTCSVGGWVGPRAGWDMAKRKNLFPIPAGNQTLVVQPVA